MKIKNRQQLLTIAAVAVVVLFAADKLLISPLGHFWKERSKRIAELRKKVEDGNQLVKHEQSWRSRWDQMKHDTDEYTTLQCRVEASGSLNALSRFLYDIEKDPSALRLEIVELSSRDNEGQQLALGLQISGLVLTPQERRP